MRFSRDRRGYEHTYVLHAFRGEGRQEPRVLYWFRTPPHVRVGRAAIDEEAIRMLEETHPDVSFDWSRMLKAQPPPAPPVEEHPRRRQRPRDAERSGRAGSKSPAQRAQRPMRPVTPEPARIEEALEADIAEPASLTEEPLERAELLEPVEPLNELDRAELLEPAEPLEPVEPADSFEPPRTVSNLLEPAILERLQVRYAELMARIAQRISDPVKRDVLRGEAERLNPETWVTAEEARNGLEHFEEWFEAIRAQLPAPRRRRHRRRRQRGGPAGSEPPAGATEV